MDKKQLMKIVKHDKSYEKLSDREVLFLFINQFVNNKNSIIKTDEILSKIYRLKYLRQDKNDLSEIINELVKRITEPIPKEKISVNSPENIINYFKMHYFNKDKEIFYLMTLNSKLQFINIHEVSKGEIDHSAFRIRDIIRHSISDKSSDIVLIHNHPNQSVKPSEDDVSITKTLKYLLTNMDIRIVDHIIVSNDDYYSMRSHNDF